jgi:hypothetical protein
MISVLVVILCFRALVLVCDVALALTSRTIEVDGDECLSQARRENAHKAAQENAARIEAEIRERKLRESGASEADVQDASLDVLNALFSNAVRRVADTDLLNRQKADCASRGSAYDAAADKCVMNVRFAKG